MKELLDKLVDEGKPVLLMLRQNGLEFDIKFPVIKRTDAEGYYLIEEAYIVLEFGLSRVKSIDEVLVYGKVEYNVVLG